MKQNYSYLTAIQNTEVIETILVQQVPSTANKAPYAIFKVVSSFSIPHILEHLISYINPERTSKIPEQYHNQHTPSLQEIFKKTNNLFLEYKNKDQRKFDTHTHYYITANPKTNYHTFQVRKGTAFIYYILGLERQLNHTQDRRTTILTNTIHKNDILKTLTTEDLTRNLVFNKNNFIIFGNPNIINDNYNIQKNEIDNAIEKYLAKQQKDEELTNKLLEKMNKPEVNDPTKEFTHEQLCNFLGIPASEEELAQELIDDENKNE